MLFTQYYLDCLSQASYLIADEDSGLAVVVDPRRDVEEYLDDARTRGLTIVGIINTHFHADFLSGHLELAEQTGAWIGYGSAGNPEFEHRKLVDGERIDLGGVTLEIMETPGHTPESISVLVRETPDAAIPYGVLTGDALFIGDVGRPDLLASVGVTADELARMLYHSVHDRLMSLPDAVRVFPAHGAGSSCGKNLSTERQSTIGEQRRFNYACQPMSKDDFIAVVTEGQPSAPAYFSYDATLNKQVRPVRPLGTSIPELDDTALAEVLAAGAVVHDARSAADFNAGHLRGAINVPFDGRLAETAGMVFTADQRIIVMADDGREQEVAVRLARIGFDGAIGYIPDPEVHLEAHENDTERSSRLTVAQMTDVVADSDIELIDIRNPGETDGGIIPGAKLIPLPELPRRLEEVDTTKPVLLYCASGWRSSVGASLLRAKGISDVSDLLGGYDAWARVHPLAS